MTFVEEIRTAVKMHGAEALEARKLLASWWRGPITQRIGMDSATALAHRIYHGKTIEEAAAREYLYRWSIALQSPTFGVPHCLGL